MTTDTPNYVGLLKSIDTLNDQDPNRVDDGSGGTVAAERLYSHRMLKCLQSFQPDACPLLHIAAYSQHIQRWIIPRSDYPATRSGYKQWRTDLGKFHADTTAELMQKHGYDETSTEKVKYLLQKKGLKRDSDTQALEDVICLVFLEFYLEAFARKHTEEKLIIIIQKTWKKMSDKGHMAALQLPLAEHLLRLMKKALNI
jgi:hypothetical protein